jgi:predicted 3-demethylubiquinone-9 3-methyltransferase (glyoxalase superfamily)
MYPEPNNGATDDGFDEKVPKGTVITTTFTPQDEEFIALSGGPHFKFNEAVSFMVRCRDQAETKRTMQAMMTMKKIDIAAVERAPAG